MECEQYLKVECGFAPVATNPADFIIHVARETRDNGAACKFTLQHMAAMAKKKFEGGTDGTVEDPPDVDIDTDVVAEGFGLGRVVKIARDNMSADIEDIKKSRVTIRVLCEREFLKELRRYKFWLTAMVRAIILGCLLGMYSFLSK
jgi:hypothetical protein